MVNEHLMMENYPGEELDAVQEDLPFEMPDFLGTENLFADPAAAPTKKHNKKTVQQIRQAMMKLDKKTQRQQVITRAADDEDDIVRNMTNLILHKNDESVKPWEKGLMSVDTAANSSISNIVLRGPSFKGKQTKKLLSSPADASILLNPMVESFLSFNINNQTNVQTNANVTANLNHNVLDQTLFTLQGAD